MPKVKENQMATKREEITHVLEGAGEKDIEIVHLKNEMIIPIRFESKPSSAEQKKRGGGRRWQRNFLKKPLFGV
jgi:hypothetical protein